VNFVENKGKRWVWTMHIQMKRYQN
jgi:hypothetical protein